MATKFTEDVNISGNLSLTGSFLNPLTRASALVQETLVPYPVELTSLRIWDAANTVLTTAGTDNLGLVTGTWGTDAPTVQTSDLKNTIGTQYALFYASLPAEYVAGQTVVMRISAGMVTTIASTTGDLDLQVYEVNRIGGLVGSPTDLCATSAVDINSLTAADQDFTITASALEPGDLLVCRVSINIVDSATGTAVIGEIGAIELLCDIKG